MKFSARLTIAIATSTILAGCGFNLLYYVSTAKDEPRVLLEDAKIKLDAKDYSGAAEILNKMKDNAKKDSNDVRLMLAAANLGVSGLDLWSVIGKLLNTKTQSSGSVNTLLSTISDNLLGEGEEKAARILALEDAIDGLKSSPEPDDDRIENTSCFLAGVLVVPTLSDGTTAMEALQSAVTAASQGDCDGAAGLSTSLGDISEVAGRFSTILDTAKSCPFLKLDTSQVDGVNGALNTLIASADKGCDGVTDETAALLPQCVRTAAGIPNSSAVTGDKRIDSCELVLHCYDPSACFK
jgi:hypothetical protein